MPAIGEIKKGMELGKQPLWKQYMWVVCPKCGKERWAQAKRGNPDHILCVDCYNNHRPRGQDNKNWKGGRSIDRGYVLIHAPEHPYVRSKRGIVYEHILVWEQVHNMPVPEDCQIHHINGVRSDNRPKNLVCITSSEHAKISSEHLKSLTQVRLQRIRELEMEIKLLEKALDSSQMIFRLEEN